MPWNAPPGYRTKSERIIETSVASLLGPADADNIAFLMQFLGENATPAIGNVDVSDIDAWAGERLRARLSSLEEDDVARDEVAQAVVRQYTAQGTPAGSKFSGSPTTSGARATTIACAPHMQRATIASSLGTSRFPADFRVRILAAVVSLSQWSMGRTALPKPAWLLLD